MTTHDISTGAQVALTPGELAARGSAATPTQRVLDRFVSTETRPSLGYGLGSRLRSTGFSIAPNARRGLAYGAVTAATIAALLMGTRALARKMTNNRDVGPSGRAVTALSALGGMGAGTYGLLKGAATSDEGLGELRQLILRATDMTLAEKQKAIDLAASLPQTETQKLTQLLRLAAGFGVGAIVARFFGLRGWIGATVGGTIGAFAASQLRHSNTNRYGQPMQTGRDWKGNSF